MASSGSKPETENSAVNWEVGPTEDVVQALLEALVDPRLPFSVSINDIPSIDEQNSVARQMHAVVLLYNYYHRNQKPDLEFLDFVSFCKLALSQRPTLTEFLKMTKKVESTASNVDEDRLTVTEKAVKDACDIAMALEASHDVSTLQGWPIWKVAVLLIDSKRENCLLRYGAVTEGVWSPFECDVNREALAKDKVGVKRKSCNYQNTTDDSMFLQIAFDAVKGITGIDRSDLVYLESHTTYSLSRINSAVRFYMMQYRKQFDTKQIVPLEFLVESLRGPLAKKDVDSWRTTDFVEYHQMLPYMGFISSWLSRKDLCLPSSNDRIARIATKCGEKETTQIKTEVSPISEPCKNLPIKGSSQNTVTNESFLKKLHKRSKVAVKEEEKIVNHEIFDSTSKGTQSMIEFITKSEDSNYKLSSKTEVYNQTRETISSSQHDVSLKSDKKKNAENQSDVAVKENPLQLVQFEASHNNNIEIKNEHDSEDLQTSLDVFCRKRQELCFQRNTIDDALALYEDCIERLRDGDVDLARQCIKSIVNRNDEFLPKNITEPRTGFSDIFLPGQSSCQDLEYICIKNNWRLPRYFVEPSDGKFLSNVFVGSKNFELSLKGGLENCPREARECAATQMIAKLRERFSG